MFPRLIGSKLLPWLLLCGLLLTARSPLLAQQLSAAENAAWTQRLTNLIPGSLEGAHTMQDLAALPPDTTYALLTANWKSLANADVKQYLLSSLAQNDNVRILDILHLGATDPALVVQNRALQSVESFGFQSFLEDYDAYLQWHDRYAGKPLQTVITESMKNCVATLANSDEARRTSILTILVRTNFQAISQNSRWRRQAAIEAGLPDALAPSIKQQNNLMWTAFQILRNIRPNEDFLRRVILPLTDAHVDINIRYQALNTLATPENTWAVAPLLKMMLAEYPDAAADTLGQTLGMIGDPRVIPTFIAILDSDDTQEGQRVIGNSLAPLTGVNTSILHDAHWWHNWWDHNTRRFSAEVRATPFPRLALRARPVLQPFQNGVQPVAQPVLHQIANDPKRAYWLINPREGDRLASMPARRLILSRKLAVAAANVNGNGVAPGIKVNGVNGVNDVLPPAPPNAPAQGAAGVQPAGAPEAKAGGMGLLVVLTSDGNAADFVSFWNDVAQRALSRRYLIAVVVAPKWMENQPVTWVTQADMKTVKDAKFNTETLVADVVKDVAAAHPVDANRVFLHGVGNAGLAAYAASLEENTPFKGFYILASSFKSAQLPALTRAKGRRYLIQNAPDDKVHPYWMAEAAQKLLTEKGATVKLVSTNGYQGAQANDALWDQFKTTLEWLESSK